MGKQICINKLKICNYFNQNNEYHVILWSKIVKIMLSNAKLIK